MTRLWRWLRRRWSRVYTYRLWLPYHDRWWWPRGWWAPVAIAAGAFAAIPIARHLYL